MDIDFDGKSFSIVRSFVHSPSTIELFNPFRIIDDNVKKLLSKSIFMLWCCFGWCTILWHRLCQSARQTSRFKKHVLNADDASNQTDSIDTVVTLSVSLPHCSKRDAFLLLSTIMNCLFSRHRSNIIKHHPFASTNTQTLKYWLWLRTMLSHSFIKPI